MPTSVRIDGQRIGQVLANLLSNALRYTPSGGKIAVRAWEQDNQAFFAVQDSGIGIAPEDMNLLFDRFYRADRSRSRADGGSGLGLAIARELVEAHGGTITVHSELGHGSEFTVCLPSYSSSPSSPSPG